jgi:hypothetical protein
MAKSKDPAGEIEPEDVFDHPADALREIADDLEHPERFASWKVYVATCKNAAETLREIADSEWEDEDDDEEDEEDGVELPASWVN